MQRMGKESAGTRVRGKVKRAGVYATGVGRYATP
jgi:hypothetical protein